MKRAMPILVAALTMVAAACADGPGRPGPTGPTGPPVAPKLVAQLLDPAQGATIPTDEDIVVRVQARDTGAHNLAGVGYVARLLLPGQPVVDSAVVRFPARSDSTHEFTMRLPITIATNTQLDVYGLAIGPSGEVQVSAPIHATVVRCIGGVCH